MARDRAASHTPDSREGPAFDVLVVTAANEAQARGYRAQLRAREQANLLQHCRKWLVVADPGGRRVGSGAATAHALMKALARTGDSDGTRPRGGLSSLRIAILHSGGDARRLPAYAA